MVDVGVKKSVLLSVHRMTVRLLLGWRSAAVHSMFGGVDVGVIEGRGSRSRVRRVVVS